MVTTTRKEDGRKIIILERNRSRAPPAQKVETSRMRGKTLDKIMETDTTTTKGSAMILKRLKKSIIEESLNESKRNH